MGKYEEPIELELVQRGASVSGTVAMVGYPGTEGGPERGDAPLALTGRLEAGRLTLAWRSGARRFTAELTLAGPGRLVGLGGENGQVTVGFLVERTRGPAAPSR
jgi:hypothetical protein